MEVAYFTLGDKQLYVNLGRLLGRGGGKGFSTPIPSKLLGRGVNPLTLSVPTPMIWSALKTTWSDLRTRPYISENHSNMSVNEGLDGV